jgi:hypothetical protein
MFILGDYAVEKKTGLAIWLRCVIAGKTSSVELPNGSTPILYLSCPKHLKSLAEL